MGLRGQFSNHLLSDLLQCLTGSQAVQVPPRRSRAGWPDGRRRFGTVSGAIIEALGHGREMSVKAIRTAVEAKLGGPVSRFSVSDYLLTRSKGSKPLFERTRHGHYRLRR
jgi:hypothetical protein